MCITTRMYTYFTEVIVLLKMLLKYNTINSDFLDNYKVNNDINYLNYVI